VRRAVLVVVIALVPAMAGPLSASLHTPLAGPVRCDEAFHVAHKRQRAGVELVGVDFASSKEGWAVGSRESAPPLVVRFDARSFEVATRLPRFRGSVYLDAVSATASNQVFVAGSQVKWHRRWETLVLRWDGRSWDRMRTPQPGRNALLHGIEALSPTDVWAVGGLERYDGDEETLVLHYDGRSWSRVAAPTPRLAAPYPTGHYARLGGVSASSPDDVWAIGNFGNDDIMRPLVLHWDGSQWTRVRLPASINSPGPPRIPGAQSEHELSGVDALAPDDVWVVGHRMGRGKGSAALLLHYDGTAWHKTRSADLRGSEWLHGIEAVDSKEVWAVGWRWGQEVGYGFPLALRWDGSTWSTVGTGRVNEQLFGVASDEAGSVWAVGDGWGIERACKPRKD
jgi:hypothetical protein